jgi:hypothetical protein
VPYTVGAWSCHGGWIAYNRLEVRKAAEAGALAGVVHTPLPGSVTFGAGAEPRDTALIVANQAGYDGAINGASVHLEP